MTKKDYELIAKTLATAVTVAEVDINQVGKIINIFIKSLEDENPKFDIYKFHDYFYNLMRAIDKCKV